MLVGVMDCRAAIRLRHTKFCPYVYRDFFTGWTNFLGSQRRYQAHHYVAITAIRPGNYGAIHLNHQRLYGVADYRHITKYPHEL